MRTQVSQQACWRFAREFRAVSTFAGGVDISKQGVTISKCEVGGTSSDGDRPRTVLKLAPEIANTNVLLGTSAVRVINPRTGNSTLVYGQHDTASQVTVVSERLVNELDLNVNSDHVLNIRMLAEQTTKSAGFTELKLQSLTTNEVFEIKNALVVSNFIDNEGALPHSVNVRNLNHFKGVEIPEISYRKSIDILIRQTDILLLTVLKEREGLLRDEPNLVITRLGPIASGGCANLGSNLPQNQKVKLREDSDSCETCNNLKQEIAILKESVRNFEREDELIQPSKHDEIARGMVEANVKVING